MVRGLESVGSNSNLDQGNGGAQRNDEDLQMFTLNDAYEHVGGFGRFQIIALILLAMLREMGHYHLQAFALLIMPPESYHCQYQLDVSG